MITFYSLCSLSFCFLFFFFFNDTATTEIYTLSLHDALPIFDYVPESLRSRAFIDAANKVIEAHFGWNNFYNEPAPMKALASLRSEEHTSELQSQFHLVCRLLLEKKKQKKKINKQQYKNLHDNFLFFVFVVFLFFVFFFF